MPEKSWEREAREARDRVDTLLAAASVTFKTTLLGERADAEPNGNLWKHDAWNVTLQRGAMAQDFGFKTGLGLRIKPTLANPNGKPIPPRAADVLSCLLSDAEASKQSFNDWCGDTGNNSDSIRAFRMYQECCEAREKLARVLTAEERDKLRLLLEGF